MRWSILFFFILLMVRPLSEQPVLKEIEDFGPDLGDLKMYIHPPQGENDSGNKPLLLALHGCNQNADQIAQRSGWNKLADQNGFYVLYPQQGFWNNPSKCFNWFKGKDTKKGRGELRSIRSMIAYMTRNFPIDTSKVHLYGVSTGGAMGSVLLATYPQLFQSGAIYKGYQGASVVKRRVHTNEEGKEVVIRYGIADIGHRSAIDPGDEPRQGGETNISAKDMDFHSTYWIGKDLGLVGEDEGRK